MPYIVQVEMFHAANERPTSLQAMIDDCNERIPRLVTMSLVGDEPHLVKCTTIRFFDDGAVFEVARTIDALRARGAKRTARAAVSTNWLGREWHLSWAAQRTHNVHQKRPKLLACVRQKLRETIEGRYALAREGVKGSYRVVELEEMRELERIADNSNNTHVTILQAFDLLSSSAEVVISKL